MDYAMETVSRIRDWDEIYKGSKVNELPWFRKKLDDDIKNEIKQKKLESINVLDLGTGPGTQAFALLKLGFYVTATDISVNAINEARKLSNDIEFIADDILYTKIEKKFDLILDRGCFHTIDLNDRKKYLDNIEKLLNQNGFLFLKCFSDKEPDTGTGPYRISESFIKELFGNDFVIEKIIHTEFRGNRKPNPKALFCVMMKK